MTPHSHTVPINESNGMQFPALATVCVAVNYGKKAALNDVSFSVNAGEMVAVVGPNGAGKSSLFKALAGFISHEGEVELEGVCCHHKQRGTIAYIPQRADVDFDFPITVHQLVAAGRRRFRPWWKRPSIDDEVAVTQAIAEVDLSSYTNTPIGQLSGGQAQRAFIARALAQDADVLLLDEAFSGVDAVNTATLFDLFEQLTSRGTTILVSTHDLGLARKRFARCIGVNGTVCTDGPPEESLTVEALEVLFGSPVHNPDGH